MFLILGPGFLRPKLPWIPKCSLRWWGLRKHLAWLSLVIQTALCWILFPSNCTLCYFVSKFHTFFFSGGKELQINPCWFTAQGIHHVWAEYLLLVLTEGDSTLPHVIGCLPGLESLNNWKQIDKQRLKTGLFPSKWRALAQDHMKSQILSI